MLLEYKAEGMSLRNDNGSQFIATAVREYLKEKGILPGVLSRGHTTRQRLHRSPALKPAARGD